MTLFAEATIECGHTIAAAALLTHLEPYADLLSCDDVTAEGPVAHFLGGLSHVLGRHDDADAHFAKAAAFSARVDAKFFGARTDLAWARTLLAPRRTG